LRLTQSGKQGTVFLYFKKGDAAMTITTTYTQARANLAKYFNAATENREIIIIERKKKGDVALIAADELTSLLETAYLLRSPKNAERLLTALERALKNGGNTFSIDALRAEVGLESEEA
jgi:antitoxin YefM